MVLLLGRTLDCGIANPDGGVRKSPERANRGIMTAVGEKSMIRETPGKLWLPGGLSAILLLLISLFAACSSQKNPPSSPASNTAGNGSASCSASRERCTG